jgi:hypothetical protein
VFLLLSGFYVFQKLWRKSSVDNPAYLDVFRLAGLSRFVGHLLLSFAMIVAGGVLVIKGVGLSR